MLGMAHITLSIPDDVYKEMKRHPEIKWSQVARETIIQKTKQLKGTIHGRDILKMLSPEAQKDVREIPLREWINFYKEMKKKEWKRTQLLTQLSRSAATDRA